MENTISKESQQNYRRTLYFVLFLYIVWIGAWLLERALEPEIGWINTNGGQFTYWTIMTVLLWLLPSIALIHGLGYRVREVIAFNRWRSAILWGCSAGFILILIKLIINAYNHQPLFSLPVNWSFATSVIVAPIVEEITFRGAVLRGLMLRHHFAVANTLTAIFFLGAHLPGWFFQGKLSFMLTHPVGGAISILIIGWILGLVAFKSNSVLGSILTHMLNNLF
jgi:membrane protease YdiL (CAAX protease family)